MSAITIFLGKLIGVYCLIIGLTMMANRRTMVDAVNTLIRSPPLVLLAGVFAVAAGLGLVIGHHFGQAARCRSSSPLLAGHHS
jgi:hypothetical protein